jgi:hypothetical protein
MGITVEVRRVKHKPYPCVKCCYYNRQDFPKSLIHHMIISGSRQLPKLEIGTDQAFIERLGTCEDFKEKSKGG